MRIVVAALALAMLLAACSGSTKAPAARETGQAVGLEQAAIEAGVIRDPADTGLTGLYARDTDRLCVVPAADGYRIGAFVDYGDQLTCSGSGIATRSGESVHIVFDGAAGCSFDARFDGDRISFPGSLPDACQALCSRRASFAALSADQLSQSISEARAPRGPRGRLLCGGG